MQDVLNQKHEEEWTSWIDEGQGYQGNIAHDSCPNSNADPTSTSTKGQGANRVYDSISETREDSKDLNLEQQVAYLQIDLHSMSSDHYILSRLSSTWKDHLALNLEKLTEALSWDQGQNSERGEPIKGSQ